MRSLKTLRNHLDERGIRYALDKDAPLATFSMNLDSCFVHCAAACGSDGLRLTLRGYVKCPPEKLGAMALFVAQANWGLSIGRFDLNVRDGEVVYSAYAACAPAELTDGMLESLIGASLGTYARYAKGLGELVWTDADPTDLIQRIEKPEEETDEDPAWMETMERLMAEPPSETEAPPGENPGGEGPTVL